MIEVKRNGYNLTIKGHSGSTEVGKDLICASASILFYTLVECVSRYESMGRCKAQIKALSGDAEVKVIPSVEYENELLSAFNTIMTGYEILESDYPEYIKII